MRRDREAQAKSVPLHNALWGTEAASSTSRACPTFFKEVSSLSNRILFDGVSTQQ